uniref:Uncharacterized protein n=1 Tax=Timema cristinae TaxID=61476 RepID=A0A7R9CQS7_TIMCR|nr:unnamed protein product [Timema cristinae]
MGHRHDGAGFPSHVPQSLSFLLANLGQSSHLSVSLSKHAFAKRDRLKRKIADMFVDFLLETKSSPRMKLLSCRRGARILLGLVLILAVDSAETDILRRTNNLKAVALTIYQAADDGDIGVRILFLKLNTSGRDSNLDLPVIGSLFQQERTRKAKFKESIPVICVEAEWKTSLEKTHHNTPDRDLNLDLPIIGSLVYYESSTSDNEAT